MRLMIGMLVLMFAGCADDGPTLVPVNGKATLDGKALPFKHIEFVPEAGTPGMGAGANTGEDGSYTLLATRPGSTRDMQGTPAGKYRIVVSEPVIPIEQAMPANEDQPDKAAPAIGLPKTRTRLKVAIPAVYTNADRTPLHIEVSATGGVIDVTLKSGS